MVAAAVVVAVVVANRKEGRRHFGTCGNKHGSAARAAVAVAVVAAVARVVVVGTMALRR